MQMTPSYSCNYPISHSGGGGTCYCLPGWHLEIDVKTTPKDPPGQGWACVSPGKRVTSLWPLYHHWQHCVCANSDGKVSRSDERHFLQTLPFSSIDLALSCQFLFYNFHPSLTRDAAQVLIQACVISPLVYCNILLAGAPASAIRPLQLILAPARNQNSKVTAYLLLQTVHI